MQYQVHEVTEKWQLDAITDVLWAAMDGTEPSHDIFFPTFGGDRESAVAASKERLWKGHEMDPSSHWIYVLEEDRIVGGCQWRIYAENPFPDPTARVNAVFWPEGTGREFASEVASQCHGQRKAWMGRSHAGISLMGVLPDKQRRGIGAKLMEWGLQQMNDQDLEGFVEASVRGRLLYLQHGFIDIARVRVSMNHADIPRSETWREFESRNLPVGYMAMWRPRQGKLDATESRKVWQQRLQVPVRAHIEALI